MDGDEQVTTGPSGRSGRSRRSAGSIVGFLRVLPPLSERGDQRGRVELMADDLAPGLARRAAREALTDAGLAADEIAVVQLVVSELVTNVVRHGGPRLQLYVHPSESGVRVEVTDHGGGLVQRRPVTESSPSGRGLSIVDTLTEAWGVAERLDTKTVWCEVRTGRDQAGEHERDRVERVG